MFIGIPEPKHVTSSWWWLLSMHEFIFVYTFWCPSGHFYGRINFPRSPSFSAFALLENLVELCGRGRFLSSNQGVCGCWGPGGGGFLRHQIEIGFNLVMNQFQVSSCCFGCQCLSSGVCKNARKTEDVCCCSIRNWQQDSYNRAKQCDVTILVNLLCVCVCIPSYWWTHPNWLIRLLPINSFLVLL